MGYMRHHAIIVSGWQDEAVLAAHEKAQALLDEHDDEGGTEGFDSLVTPIVRGLTNGYSSFAILPDGSKEWWSTSDAVERARADFLRWLRDADGYLKWVEVQFGDDDGVNRITAHSDDDGDDPYAPESDEIAERTNGA